MKFTQARINAFRPPAGKSEHEEIDDAMSGFGVRWRASGDGRYGEGVYFAKAKIGRWHSRLSLGKIKKVSLEDAQTEARDFFGMVARKVNPSTERAKAVVMLNDTIANPIDGFLAYLRDDKKRSAGHVSDVTRTLRKYLTELHRFNPADVDRAMVVKALGRIKTESGASTADHCRSHLSTFFAWLMATGVPIVANPVDGTPTSGRKPREKLLTWDEMRLIWAALPPVGDDYGDAVRLLFLLGPRREEIAALVDTEIDFKAKQIELPGTRTKSRRPHVIPLPRQALEILQARASRKGLVFGRGGNVLSSWSWHKRQLDERASVHNWVLHDARRLISTVMNEDLKIEPHVVEAVLGHVVSGVRGVYFRGQYLNAKRTALQEYADFFLTQVAAKPARRRPSKPQRKQEAVGLSP